MFKFAQIVEKVKLFFFEHACNRHKDNFDTIIPCGKSNKISITIDY